MKKLIVIVMMIFATSAWCLPPQPPIRLDLQSEAKKQLNIDIQFNEITAEQVVEILNHLRVWYGKNGGLPACELKARISYPKRMQDAYEEERINAEDRYKLFEALTNGGLKIDLD